MQNVIVKQTKDRGKGVFALRDFQKEELILYVAGEVVETSDPSSFPQDVQDHWYPFDRKEGKIKYVLPQAPWTYLNHSCNPNAGIKNNRDIVAMKPIKQGEEITFDYAMNNLDEWRMPCHCGGKNCRKTVSTFEVLDRRTQKKYLPFVLDVIREEFENKM